MKVNFESRGDFKKLEAWLKGVATRDPTPALNKIAEAGIKSLSANTPKDTGDTARGWSSEIEKTNEGANINWTNKAHPGLNVNVAKIIDQGHGTRNGGYVSPQPYIQKSMEGVWKTAGDEIEKELIR